MHVKIAALGEIEEEVAQLQLALLQRRLKRGIGLGRGGSGGNDSTGAALRGHPAAGKSGENCNEREKRKCSMAHGAFH